MNKFKSLIILIIAALLMTACSAGSPEIESEIAHFELGDVVNGDVIIKEILISNVGTETLIIESVSSSCGCTTVSISENSIEPGNPAVLHIEFDSGAHGPDEIGLISRQIFIDSNDPAKPEIVLEFTANVIPNN